MPFTPEERQNLINKLQMTDSQIVLVTIYDAKKYQGMPPNEDMRDFSTLLLEVCQELGYAIDPKILQTFPGQYKVIKV